MESFRVTNGLLRLIWKSKKKNDRADAWKLAKLLYGDVPEVPPTDVRDWRETITFRKRLIEKRTRVKNALRSLAVEPPEFGLWTKKGRVAGSIGAQGPLGHITKEGPAAVRAVLCEAVWQAVRWSPTIRVYQQRIARGDKDRRKNSVMATARDLVRVMWSMLKNGTVWQEKTTLVN